MTTRPAPPDFVPAPSRRRIAGWTPARQAAFLAAMADGHSVAAAAASVGLSARSAYQLRRAAGAGDFAAAWDGARGASMSRLDDTAIDRAIYGERRPIYYRGEAVGEKTVFNDRLLIDLIVRRFSKRGKSVRG